jgi:hypothetical protein
MKGVSTIVVEILLVLIALSLIAAVYLWSTSVVFESYPGGELSHQYQRSRACLSLEQINIMVTASSAIIRNCGLVPLSNMMFYIDNAPVVFEYPSSLDPNANFTVTFTKPASGSHSFFAVADLAETPLMTSSN